MGPRRSGTPTARLYNHRSSRHPKPARPRVRCDLLPAGNGIARNKAGQPTARFDRTGLSSILVGPRDVPFRPGCRCAPSMSGLRTLVEPGAVPENNEALACQPAPSSHLAERCSPPLYRRTDRVPDSRHTLGGTFFGDRLERVPNRGGLERTSASLEGACGRCIDGEKGVAEPIVTEREGASLPVRTLSTHDARRRQARTPLVEDHAAGR